MIRSLIYLLLVVSCQLSIAQTNILPTPSFVRMADAKLYFSDSIVRVEEGGLSEPEFEFLKAQFRFDGVELRTSAKNKADITFHHLKMLLTEAYDLEIGNKIKISSNGAKGRFYGMLSLLQLMHRDSGVLALDRMKVEDAPAFSWRGLHLDVSRHFFTVEEVKRFLDLMALYKFNTFHWHLTDDQGWRIEIKQYPRLTEIGGFRDSTLIGHYNDTPRRYDRTRYGGFYTQEQIRDVVAYAQQLHINIVPEIEMPGHSRAALAAYPEFSCTGEELGVPGLWGVFEDIYCCNEETIVFLQNVLDEVLELFPSEYIHIGGDEAPKTRWNESEDCKKMMEDNGLKDAHELQSYFIKRMDTFLTDRGRKLIGWDEILEGGLSPNAAVMSWRGEKGGIEAAKQGHYVVMSPTSHCYFDYYQSSHKAEPLAIGGFLPLEKVYQFNPIPEALTKDEAKYILGGQANVWTEYIPRFTKVEYMVYPRAIALMQSLWCQKKPDYDTFLNVYLTKHEDFLKRRDVDYSKSIHIPELKIERVDNGVAYSWHGRDSTKTYELYWMIFDSKLGGNKDLADGEKHVFLRSDTITDIYLEVEHYTNGFEAFVSSSHCLGAEVELITKPDRAYNHNGSLNLVDGIMGGKKWRGNEWLGFREKKVEIIVEMDSVVNLDTLTIGFLNQNGSWIYLPESVKISVSNDKSSWKDQARIEISNVEKIVRPKIGLKTTGKYVKIEVTPIDAIPEGNGGAGSIPWTFIDEIQIFTQ